MIIKYIAVGANFNDNFNRSFEQIDSIKYLGVDKKVSWAEHINDLQAKPRRLMPVFVLPRKLVSKQTLHALSQTRLSYEIYHWGTSFTLT